MPPSPMVNSFRRIRKAVIRVASSVVLSDQISATDLTVCLRNFLNWRRYGRSGSNDCNVIRIVAESVKLGRKWLMDVENVRISGDSFLNWEEFVGTVILPFFPSL